MDQPLSKSARDGAVQNVSEASQRERLVARSGGVPAFQDLAEAITRSDHEGQTLVDDGAMDRALDSVAAAIVDLEVVRAEHAAADTKDLALERAAELLLEAGALIACVRRVGVHKERIRAVREAEIEKQKIEPIGTDG